MVKINNLIVISGKWSGTATNETKIATIPSGYRPSETITGGGMLVAADDTRMPAEYTINSSGVIAQAESVSGCKSGSFVLCYTVAS